GAFTRGAIQYGAVGFIEGYAYSGITQAMTTGKVDHAEALTTATVSMLFAGIPGGFISKNVVKTSAVANVNKIRYAGSTESLKNLRKVNVRASRGPGEDFVMVYRGTSRVKENWIYKETGHLLSDAGQEAYVFGTRNIDLSYAASRSTHNKWIRVMGNETKYVQEHARLGGELSARYGMDRTLISVTTDPKIARQFAGEGGTIYSGLVPRSQLIPQTLPGATESEMLLRYGTNLLSPSQMR
ncbi:MAG: hypothetical protein FWG40_03425, partial [Peptococcaceae bacterium]|nr:hypothetical protein [Peptococcaceae bacterium]